MTTLLRTRSNGMMMNASSDSNDEDVDSDDDQNDNEMIVAIGRSIEKVEEKDEEDNIYKNEKNQ